MSDRDRGILMYETTLGPEARSALRDIGAADVVIGIPSYRNGRTIDQVVRSLVDGIATYLPDRRVVLMNSDGGSTDGTPEYLQETELCGNVTSLIARYQGQSGKGTATRAIFEATMEVGARACAIVEARAPGICAEWVPGLVDPILRGADIVLPRFAQSPYGSALNDNVMYPFLAMVFGSELRQPLVSEFALSGALAAQYAGLDVWETDISRFGINTWMSLQATVNKLRTVEVSLGTRGCWSGEPGNPLDTRFLHTVSILFRVLTTHRRMWQSPQAQSTIEREGRRVEDSCLESEVDPALLWDACLHQRDRYDDLWRHILLPTTMAAIDDLLRTDPEEASFPNDLWVRVLCEFAIVFNRGEGDPDKVVEALLPLFYARSAAFCRASEGLTVGQREDKVAELAQAFVAFRPQFLSMWNEYEPWISDTPGYLLT